MKIATWNIYWLGDRSGEHIARSEADEALIAQVLARLAPDVLALQEIVDPFAMERILGQASGPGREYVLRANNAWLTSDPDPTAEKNVQKAFLCFNAATVEFVQAAALQGGPKIGRKPYAARLAARGSGQEFVAVAVHLRAGFPAFLDVQDAGQRRKEAAALASWLRGEAADKNPAFPRPERPEVAVLGDFNAELADPNRSLDPLALPGWRWENPAPDGPHRETALFEGDRLIIDFVVLSPALAARLRSGPAVYAWDCDPALGGPTRFHRGPDGTGDLVDYRVSDHRPVVAVFDL
jgi:endonuclease/exonuclease/phosphatase family metal-dependent hydrolase